MPRRAQTAEPRFDSVRFNLKDRRAAGVSGVAQHSTMGSGDAECVNPLNIDQQPNEHTSPPCPPPTESWADSSRNATPIHIYDDIMPRRRRWVGGEGAHYSEWLAMRQGMRTSRSPSSSRRPKPAPSPLAQPPRSWGDTPARWRLARLAHRHSADPKGVRAVRCARDRHVQRPGGCSGPAEHFSCHFAAGAF